MKSISKSKCKKLQRNRRCRVFLSTDKHSISKCGKKFIVYDHFSGACKVATGKRALKYAYIDRLEKKSKERRGE